MVKNKIIIYRGDAAHKGIVILDHQPEGVFRYYPSAEDEITLILRKENTEFKREYAANVSDPDYVYVDIESDDLESGQYIYDVVIKLKDEEKPYHIVTNKEIYVIGGK